MTNKRVKYIDALRGFTMFLVVLGHVLLTSLNIGGYDSVLSGIILTFRMPMFFFISGFIGYKALYRWTTSFYLFSLKKKLRVQIIPAAFFFSLYTICQGVNPIICFSHGFGGYWFTFVLLEMFICYFTLSYIANKLHHHLIMDFGMIVLSLLGVMVLLFLRNESNLWNFLCLENLTKYFQFFTFGILCRKYENQLFKILRNDIFKAIIIMAFIVGLLLYFDIIPNNIYLYKFNHDIIIRYVGLLLVFIFFYQKKGFWEKNKKISSVFLFIGRRTLDIYLIHFFLLPNLKFMTYWISKEGMFVIQLTVSVLVTIIIIALCLLISELIRTSDTLSYYLLGVNKNKQKSESI